MCENFMNNKNHYKIKYLILLVLFFTGCLEPKIEKVVDQNNNTQSESPTNEISTPASSTPVKTEPERAVSQVVHSYFKFGAQSYVNVVIGMQVNTSEKVLYVLNELPPFITKISTENFSNLDSFIKYGSSNGELRSPRSMSLDSQGHIYIYDAQDSTINKFTNEGVFQIKFTITPPDDQYLNQFTIDSQDRIFISYNCSVYIYNNSGRLLTYLGSTCGTANGQFNRTSKVFFDQVANAIFIADDTRIQKFSNEFVYITSYAIEDVLNIVKDSSGQYHVLSWTGHQVYDSHFNLLQDYEDNDFYTGAMLNNFNIPTALAIDQNNNLYFGIKSLRNILVKHSNSSVSYLNGGSTGSDGLTSVVGIAYNSYLGKYVAIDNQSQNLKIFDDLGQESLQLQLPSLYIANGFAIDANNNMYVSTSYHQIMKYSASGSLLTHFGSFGGSADDRFLNPSTISIGVSNTLIVADNSNFRIKVISDTGNLILKFGSYGTGDGQFGYGYLSAVQMANGDYYVLNNGKIAVFNSSGVFQRSFVASSSGVLAKDSDENLYVPGNWLGGVKKYNKNGELLLSFGSLDFLSPAYLISPYVVFVDSQDQIFVGDKYGGFIKKFNKSGEPITID